jgi:orotate phosphoribosyltransferase
MPAALPTICGAFTERRTHLVDVKALAPKKQLLQILTGKSVCRGTFTLASGAVSDLYIDAKQTTYDPTGAILVGRVGWDLVKRIARELNVRVDSIGGLTMGADPIAQSIGMIARLEDPSTKIQTFVVRKTAKTHGRHKLIEGNFAQGDSVVIVDDVITTGGSTLQAIDAIEAAGGQIAFVIVLVDRQEGGRQNIEKRGHKVVPIFTREDLIDRNAGRRSHIAVA